MKFFLSLCLLGSTALFADLNWASNYAKAFEKAKEQKKGVMIMLSKEKCDACWYMENIVFDEDELVTEIEKKFIPLYLDVHDDIHDLSFTTAPTLYFMKSNREVMKRLNGVYNIKELTSALHKIGSVEIEEKP